MWRDGCWLRVLLVTLCPKRLSQELSGVCTLQLHRSMCRQHLREIAFSSVPSVSLCGLLYNSFSLLLHIS